MPQFSHLHVHTQFSLLDGAASISNLIKKAKEGDMKAIAITDHGNMFGVPRFVTEATKAGIKPIIGCEFYLARGSRFDKTKSEEKDEKGIFHQLILAKNAIGYKNIAKLCTRGFTEGYYYKPRIDKDLLREFREGLIATTCCLASEINQCILRKGEDEAEKLFLEWLDIFGEDYYIEIQRHGIADQDTCNEVLLRWAKKYNVKVIATNDVHYVDMKDSEAQDILLCLQTGKDFNDPNRMRFDGKEFFLKTKDEMEALFKDVPEALENTQEIVDKIEMPHIKRDILLPTYALPEGFISEDDYLRHLTYIGAGLRYPELTSIIRERIDYELKIISDMGFAGYFLIVQDFTAAARNFGVSVGPGRGSAAGSVVAFCTGITNIDPIKYDLLFERFLNPERVSMPDIDIDFDDDGRERVIDYVIEKYGKNRVAQIVTFGTMAAKSSIRDVARVLGLPLHEADRIAKMVPEAPGTTLKKAFDEVKELAAEKLSENPLIRKTLNFAEILEGSARHTGIHAAGVIIAPDNLEDYIPLCTAKDASLLVTQYDGKYVESVGMLKMDFLGLKTLSVINDAIANIKENRNIEIDIDKIPLEDEKTFELYQKGDTVGTFQFESDGMRNYLRDLKPNNIEDLIAMNALFRPGPMDFIPNFINRKHGREKTEYPHEMLEPILKNTYGIMVYQEQIMQSAQVMGGFTLGGADLLRRAMGKKDAKEMEKQKAVFVDGAKLKGVDEKKATDVFSVMAKFAEYGFNRSHSAAYSVVAYQTAYLKANFPAEYMAAVLTRNMSDIKKITFFMEESRRMGIPVLGPDVNESAFKFAVNPKGEIRFGLGAVKGVGEGAVNAIVDERRQNGHFTGIYDLTSRVNLRSANKRCFESLAYAGAFDSFKNIHRAQYFFGVEGNNLIEKAIRYGASVQESKNASQHSLFGESTEVILFEPVVPPCEPWSTLDQLKNEKEVTGIYISGHPLDAYKLEMDNFCTHGVSDLESLPPLKGKEICLAGIVIAANHRTTKTGKPFGNFTIEDYSNSLTLSLFSEDYLKMKHFLNVGEFLFIKGRVQNRFQSEDVFELKVTSIQLLSEVREKLLKSITLQFPLTEINPNMVATLAELFKTNPGKSVIRFEILDPQPNGDTMLLGMKAGKYKVNAVNDFIHALHQIEGLRMRIN